MSDAARPSLGGEAEPLHLIDCSPLLAGSSVASAELAPFSVTSQSDGELLTANAQLRVDRTNRGVRIVGNVNGLQEGSCARCLEPASAKIATRLDEEVLEDRFAGGEGERFGRGNSVDVGRMAIEGLDLNRHFVLRCDPPCPERCERCGAAHLVRECPERELDPRLAALGRLIPPAEPAVEPPAEPAVEPAIEPLAERLVEDDPEAKA